MTSPIAFLSAELIFYPCYHLQHHELQSARFGASRSAFRISFPSPSSSEFQAAETTVVSSAAAPHWVPGHLASSSTRVWSALPVIAQTFTKGKSTLYTSWTLVSPCLSNRPAVPSATWTTWSKSWRIGCAMKMKRLLKVNCFACGGGAVIHIATLIGDIDPNGFRCDESD